MSAQAFVASSTGTFGRFSNDVKKTSSCKFHSTRTTFIPRSSRITSPTISNYGNLRMAQGDTSQRATAKELAQLYGGSYLGTSMGLSIVSYILLYAMIAAGVDMRALVNAFGDWLATTPLGRPSVLDSISDTASTATLAYIIHKAISPIRFPLTVAATPIVARAFSKKETEDAGGDSS